MDDRALLEAAAKLLGLTLSFNPEGVLAKEPRARYFSSTWNPLLDDGDALRLAVKLNLLGLPSIKGGEQWRVDYFANGGDEYAATRRAIVRAAAALSQVEQGSKR